jgi:hypothetical protein
VRVGNAAALGADRGSHLCRRRLRAELRRGRHPLGRDRETPAVHATRWQQGGVAHLVTLTLASYAGSRSLPTDQPDVRGVGARRPPARESAPAHWRHAQSRLLWARDCPRRQVAGPSRSTRSPVHRQGTIYPRSPPFIASSPSRQRIGVGFLNWPLILPHPSPRHTRDRDAPAGRPLTNWRGRVLSGALAQRPLRAHPGEVRGGHARQGRGVRIARLGGAQCAVAIRLMPTATASSAAKRAREDAQNYRALHDAPPSACLTGGRQIMSISPACAGHPFAGIIRTDRRACHKRDETPRRGSGSGNTRNCAPTNPMRRHSRAARSDDVARRGAACWW